MSGAAFGQDTPGKLTSEYNAQRFVIEAVRNMMNIGTLVQVKKVTVAGAVGPIGRLDAQPLVGMLDGVGNVTQHGVVHNLMYFRMMGGSDKAIIMDPKAGDIGFAVFADRDLSSVKSGMKAAPPGSRRRNSMADGMFFGCALSSGNPKTYIQFTDDNKIVLSPDGGSTVVTAEAGKLTLNVGGTLVVVKSGRIDLGIESAPLGVMLAGGIVSNTIFGVL